MTPFAQLVSKTFSVGVLFGIAILAVVIVFVILQATKSKHLELSKVCKQIAELADKHLALIAFVIPLVGVIGSLIYSEVIGFDPCELCWYQRVLLYPLALYFGLVTISKEKVRVKFFGLIMSGLGLLVSSYQYLMQFGIVAEGSCAAGEVSCSQQFVTEFGFVTIPLMSATLFAVLFGILLFDHLRNK